MNDAVLLTRCIVVDNPEVWTAVALVRDGGSQELPRLDGAVRLGGCQRRSQVCHSKILRQTVDCSRVVYKKYFLRFANKLTDFS